MPSQVLSSVENNFTKGLVTEFTGLNFPENAAIDTENCEYSIIGDVTRREGINFEVNGSTSLNINRTGKAINSYVWNNAGGDGLTRLVVEQIGSQIFFYRASTATTASALSTQNVGPTIDINTFVVLGSTVDITKECEFSDGNGYLFVYHPSCDPFYCTYSSDGIIATIINVQIRDFAGINENTQVNTRPILLSAEHSYNLSNQGWTAGSAWQGISSTTINPINLGSHTFQIASGFTITNGDSVTLVTGGIAFPGGIYEPAGYYIASGTVTGYTGTSLTINLNAIDKPWINNAYNNWVINPNSTGYVNTWFTNIGNYPSNADVWWNFKNNSNIFDPATRVSQVSFNSGPAPKGKYILNAFNQQRSLVSGVPGLTNITTNVRPRTGTWFQGRVWYAGLDASQSATGDAIYTTWTENIYFSQTVQTPDNFAHCYQTNDPTSETLFDLLPTDGGVITIQGAGSIYKLFPIQNGLLVFASNGVWFITGSQGIGFAANDYTITKISNIQSISGTSFVNVMGLPYFWNQEGIYTVQPSKNGSLEVNPITVGTILSFYNSIPFSSKVYAHAAYNPIDYVIQWIYRTDQETDITSRYTYDGILNFNVYNKAFFPYTVDNTNVSINSISYVSYPSVTSSTPEPGFKYFTSYPSGGSYLEIFSDEHDTNYVDWANISSKNYTSFFTTGFKLHGQGQRRFQIPYIYVFCRNDTPNSYKIQGLWDYAISGDSGRWSTAQLVNNWSPNYGMIFRRHKIRGQGLVLQLKVTSVDGKPFDIMGWSTYETTNTGV